MEESFLRFDHLPEQIFENLHCKCLQGFTGALQGFLHTGVLKLKGLHVAGVPCSSLQGFPVCITGKPL